MEAIEEWVKDQKGIYTEDRRKRMVKGAEGMEGGTKAVETRGKRMERKNGKQER